eukprot:Hpha_TRINITY_DN30397_c0_g1::TRINITY_DN30397_c0_g1_i1::g.147140::m.147140/K01204/NAGA; alpha-N-acetylgalactosaminidase
MVGWKAAHLLVLLVGVCSGLDNGLARTPPMGWLAWERFRCTVNCTEHPNTCVSERLVKEVADVLSTSEWKEAGYSYLNIDDCWSAFQRSPQGELVPDPDRFPSGMASLADYVHGKGLRLGIYNDMGTNTCGGYPGECRDKNCSLPGHMKVDAATYADWGIDSLKMDGCNSVHTPAVLNPGYSFLGEALNQTGRPILYSCSWPDYLRSAGYPMKLSTEIAPRCNLWRMYSDIQDSWGSVTDIVDWVGNNQAELIAAAGPGHWNDPDSLIIGNFGLSFEQAKSQMALWSIMAAPLLMGNDPRNLDPKMKAILLAKEVIQVDQDVLGKQGRRVVHVASQPAHDVWVRELDGGDVAVVAWNRNTYGTPSDVAIRWSDIGLPAGEERAARDLFQEQDMGVYSNLITVSVNIDGVVMLRLSKVN